MTLAQFAEQIPEKFNVYGIEPWSHHFDSVEPDYVRDLSSTFRKAGVRVVNIPCDVRVQPCAGPEQQSATQDTYHKWVEAALILGSPSIRVHLPPGKGPDDISCAVDSLKALSAYGAEKKIVINLENDVPTSENPYRVLKVIEAVGSPYLHSLPDFCNSMQINGDPEYNYKALELLFQHALNISHVKDMEDVNGKVYHVDLDRIFAIAKKAGYRGYFSMEWEGVGDPFDGTRGMIATSVKNLS
jgi:sugar phosphate isomerase/epimerase